MPGRGSLSPMSKTWRLIARHTVPPVEENGRDGRITAVGRGILDQGPDEGGVADGSVEFLRPEQGGQGSPSGRWGTVGSVPGGRRHRAPGRLVAIGSAGQSCIGLLGVPQRLPDPEHRVGPDDPSLPELELHLARPEPGGGDVEADGDSPVVTVPLLLDDGPRRRCCGLRVPTLIAAPPPASIRP